MAKAREERIKARKAKAFRRRVIAVAVFIVVVIALVLLYQFGRPPAISNPTKVILKTSGGDITIELFDDMPITSGNFKDLVSRGIYDVTIFHRVVKNFVIQGGDTTSKGITVISIPDELPNKHSNVRGSVAMAKSVDPTSGAIVPNSATSQFFINLKDNSADLDSNFSVFGRVIDGMDVVDAIGELPTDENDRPLQTVILISAELIEP